MSYSEQKHELSQSPAFSQRNIYTSLNEEEAKSRKGHLPGCLFQCSHRQDLGSHHQPSGKATQTRVKSDPAGWSSLPYYQYSPFLLPASMGPMTTSLSAFYPNFGADFIFSTSIHNSYAEMSGDHMWVPECPLW